MTSEEYTSLRDHVFYQELLTERCTLTDAVRTFEKVVADHGAVSLKQLREDSAAAAAQTEAGATGTLVAPSPGVIADHYYGALLIQQVFSSFSDEQVRDFINLAHKEALARQISMLMHAEHVDLQKVVSELSEFSALPLGESQVYPSISIGIRVQLITSFISENLFYVGIAKSHITMRDVDALVRRFIGRSGQRIRIGGKSAGMILANTILKPAFGDPTGFEDRIGEVESYYLTAHVFNRFIRQNHLEEGHSLKYLEADEREETRVSLTERFHQGEFPDEIESQIRVMLVKLGDGPVIVRSSSLLEDSMGYQFHGKYESVFISNQGSPDERYDELVRAIRRVYVSILSSSVIEYRKDKALLDYDDMMSVLIQRVVGRQYGKYFFPATSGVAFSRNQYCWSKRLDPRDGVARIVHGLGTRAVDRGGDDYPRLLALGHPELRPEGSVNEKLKYSQRFVDVLNLETKSIETIHFIDLYNYIHAETNCEYQPSEAISLVTDSRFESPLLYPESLEPGSAVISFDALARSSFPDLIRGVIALLESRYGVPVDIEFACEGEKLHILQCRPQAEWADGGVTIQTPTATENQQLLFDTGRDIFRSASVQEIRYIIYVDGAAYNALQSPVEKLEVARTVGRANRALAGRRFIIMGPGRWGSVNLELGVKVGYEDINKSLMLVEVALERGGYRPEVSYGTHFFQDLIEADIIPLPLFPGDTGSLDLQFLSTAPSSLVGIIGEKSLPPGPVAEAVRVIDLDAVGPGQLSVYLDASKSRGCGLLG